MEFLSDTNYEFGLTTGFIDADKQQVYRGYVAVNPETKQMSKEINFLVGENVQVILERIKDL